MKDRVISHYRKLVHEPGAHLHTVTVRDVMAALEAPEQSRTNISRVWNECLRGEHDRNRDHERY